LGEEDEEEELA